MLRCGCQEDFSEEEEGSGAVWEAVDMLAQPLSELVCYANWQLSIAWRSLGMMLLKVVQLL